MLRLYRLAARTFQWNERRESKVIEFNIRLVHASMKHSLNRSEQFRKWQWHFDMVWFLEKLTWQQVGSLIFIFLFIYLFLFYLLWINIVRLML